jgi:hypothetical protein
MRNWKMWGSAIALNVVIICPLWYNYSPQNDMYRIQLLLYPLFFFIGNFIIAGGINIYNRTNGFDANSKPFFLIGLVILLIGWGICMKK